MKTTLRVLITGASSGIGAALAEDYAKAGASLVLVARREDRLAQLAARLSGYGVPVLTFPADVARDGDLERVMPLIMEKWGGLDTVVANAGFGVVGAVERLTVDDFRRQFETNVFGVIRTFHATVAALKQSRGKFAIVASVNGYLALPNSSPYAMSKFAVRALADSLREEVRPSGVSVTLLSPGFVASEIRQVDNQGVFHEHARDPIPSWIVMPATKAARQMRTAIEARRAEKAITWHGWFVIWLVRHFPRLTRGILRLFRVNARRQPEA